MADTGDPHEPRIIQDRFDPRMGRGTITVAGSCVDKVLDPYLFSEHYHEATKLP
jgi:hypothetical protein